MDACHAMASSTVRRKPARSSTPSSSAPASPGCTCCTAFASSASPRASMRRATASAAPGTGTAIPARAATSRACNIPFRSPRSSTSNGTGRRNTRRSRRSWPTPTMSPTASTCAGDILFEHARHGGHLRRSRKCWRVETDRGDRVRGQILHHGGGLPLGRQPCPPFAGRRISRGRSITPANGRMKGVDFTGLRVGVIGTGSSAIQSIPIIAAAGHRR